MKLLFNFAVFIFIICLHHVANANNDKNDNEKLQNQMNRDYNNANGDDDYDDDDENNPFILFKPIKTRKFTKKEFQLDLLSHNHLMKIIWNKIDEDKTLKKSIESNSYPIQMNFRLTFTPDLINDLKLYISDTNKDLAGKINHYIMNHLEIKERKKEILLNKAETLFSEETPTYNYETILNPLKTLFYSELVRNWYETKLFLISMFTCVLVSFILTTLGFMKKRNFFFFILVLCFLHKGVTMYEESEIRKSQIITNLIPKHCNKEKESWLIIVKKSLGMDTDKECLQYEKEISMKSHHNVNPLKVLLALISECYVELFSSVGSLVGITYEGLSRYLPFYLSPLFLLVLILVSTGFVAIVIIRGFSVWSVLAWNSKCIRKNEIGIESTKQRLQNNRLDCKHRRRPFLITARSIRYRKPVYKSRNNFF